MNAAPADSPPGIPGSAEPRNTLPRAETLYPFLRLFLPVALLLVAGAWLLGRSAADAALAPLLARESEYVLLSAHQLESDIAIPLDHVRSLAREDAVRAVYQAPEGTPVTPLEQALVTLLSRNPRYHAARWIDQHGRERAHVGRSAASGLPVVLADLQDVGSAYYFRDAMQVPADRVYISPMDLYARGGRMVEPWVPTVRFALRVSDAADNPRGLLAEGEHAVAERRAHSLKGSAGTLGMTGVSEAARELQLRLRDDGPDADVTADLARLHRALEAAGHEIRRMLAEPA